MLSNNVLLFSVLFKFIAMIIGIWGNVTVIIYTTFLSKEKTGTCCLVGNLALADLLLCLTFYPMWIIEFLQTILNVDSDQDLFCKLSRSSIWALLFASVATLLAITVDRCLYIAKPLKYPLIVTRKRISLVIFGIWFTTSCLFIILQIQFTNDNSIYRSLCDIHDIISFCMRTFMCYIPLSLILVLNIWILSVARKQRKRILAETKAVVRGVNNNKAESAKKRNHIHRFFRALKATKTFFIVVVVLAFCVFTPTVIGLVLGLSCSKSCSQMWYVVFEYEFYGINSIVNAFIYGMRHIKYRRAYGHILNSYASLPLDRKVRILSHQKSTVTTFCYISLRLCK